MKKQIIFSAVAIFLSACAASSNGNGSKPAVAGACARAEVDPPLGGKRISIDDFAKDRHAYHLKKGVVHYVRKETYLAAEFKLNPDGTASITRGCRENNAEPFWLYKDWRSMIIPTSVTSTHMYENVLDIQLFFPGPADVASEFVQTKPRSWDEILPIVAKDASVYLTQDQDDLYVEMVEDGLIVNLLYTMQQ